jgi:hypothetical protein
MQLNNYLCPSEVYAVTIVKCNIFFSQFYMCEFGLCSVLSTLRVDSQQANFTPV